MRTILVTGVGAIIGYGIIKSLRAALPDIRIVGTDIYHDAVGQTWCDHFRIAVPTDSENYETFLRNLCQEFLVDLVIPGIEQDVSWLARNSERLAGMASKFALNDPALILLANDKWHFQQFLQQRSLPHIPSYAGTTSSYSEVAAALGAKFLLKPRQSYAAKGIVQISNADDFDYWLRKSQAPYFFQKIVGSDEEEYTVGTFGFGDGRCGQKIIFQRRLSGEGATVKAVVREIPELEKAIDDIVQFTRAMGPTNFQFRLHNGQFLPLEINPRISSSTSLRHRFGFNEAAMTVDFYLNQIRPKEIVIQRGSAVRYIDEVIRYDSDSFRHSW